MEEQRKTVGHIATELMAKEPEKNDVIEMQRAMQEDWHKNIFMAVDRGKKEFDSDFYVVIETKRERLMENVIRNYFFTRSSCPSPNYDQTLFKYNKVDETIDFLWVIPSKDACLMLRENALMVDPSEHGLLSFVMDFFDGTLEAKALQLNGELILN